MSIQPTEERTTLIMQAGERRQAHQLLEDIDGHLEALTVEAASRKTRVPEQLTRVLGRVLEIMAEGGTVVIGPLPEELTTTVAAEQLGISRPTLMRMIKEREIPAHKVGTHHRLKAADVLAFRRARLERQQRALDELRVIEDAIGFR